MDGLETWTPSPAVQVALGLLVALGVGALIGLERERHARVTGEPLPAGARTFPLIALAGGLAALLHGAFGPWPLAVVLLSLAGLLALSHRASLASKKPDAHGLTTEMAALAVALLGAVPFAPLPDLAFAQRLLLCGACGTIVMGLLALREDLHGLAAKLSEDDLRAALRFLVLAAVLLPLLPDREWGPGGSLNLHEIGLVIALIAGVSFLGYVAVRWLGARKGLGLTAFFGGLVSSTAVTLAFSQRARATPKLAAACAFAIVIAGAVLFPRVVLEVAVVEPRLSRALVIPLGLMLVAALAGGALCWWLARDSVAAATPGEDGPRLANPLLLGEALKLAIALAIVRLGIALANEHLGSAGLLASAAAAGLADVDAISLSTADLVKGGLDVETGAMAVTLAVLANTLLKAGMAIVIGGFRLGRLVALALAPVVVAGVAWILFAR